MPVFRRPSGRSSRSRVRARPIDGASFDPSGRDLPLADMDQAAQKRAGRQHDGAARDPGAIGTEHRHQPSGVDFQVLDGGGAQCKVGRVVQ